MRNLIFAKILFISLIVFSGAARAETVKPNPGWIILKSTHSYADLIGRVNAAAKSHKIGVVTRASATVGAAKVLQKKIPGNMVVGLFHPRFAVRMLKASVAAGIEAPIRVYLTENSDGTATLSYKQPSFVFSPYMSEGGKDLKMLAGELDVLFANLAKQAVGK